jgi:hypothetical protein
MMANFSIMAACNGRCSLSEMPVTEDVHHANAELAEQPHVPQLGRCGIELHSERHAVASEIQDMLPGQLRSFNVCRTDCLGEKVA